MSRDTKNRFNDKNPFDVLRAEDFGGDLFEFYEPLEMLIKTVSGVDITGSRPVFLIGGRGTGKTMVLKYLSLEMQLKSFIHNNFEERREANDLSRIEFEEFLNGKNFVGIYLRFKSIDYDKIKDELDFLFLPYFSIKVAEQIFNFLKIFRNSNIISNKIEQEIVEYFIKQIKTPEFSIIKDFNSTINLIKEEIIPHFESIFNLVSYCSVKEINKTITIPNIIDKNLIFGLSDLLFSKIDYLRNKHLFILLDELEFLNDYQKRRIGALIKNSDETSVVFKISTRYLPEVLPIGDSDEVLEEIHDFRKIIIPDAFNAVHSGKKSIYTAVIKNILNKRLAYSIFFKELGIKSIDELFPNFNAVEEAISIIKIGNEYRKKHWDKFKSELKKTKTSEELNEVIKNLEYFENPLIEKLNMLLYYRGYDTEEINRMFKQYLKGENEKYKTLYNKNFLNLLFQLCSDYGVRKKYAGINIFIFLSSGIIRNTIELCSESLNIAYFFDYQPSKNNPIDIKYHNMGARHQALLQYDNMARISENLGLRVKNFITQIGTIFRRLHLNKYLIEPEPTHFETTYLNITGEAKKVFDAALNHSYLQRKPTMAPKGFSDIKKDDFLINRILAPYFEISYHLRGRTFIKASHIQELINGDIKKKRKIRLEIIKANAKKIDNTQKTLYEFDED